jgi:flagellar FliJ protein
MRRFRFTLQALLSHREHQEEQAKRILAEALQAQARLEETIAMLAAERVANRAALNSFDQRSGADSMQFVWYGNALKAQLQQQQVGLEQQKEVVHQKRLALVEAARKRRALEILREKRLATHNKAESRREMAMVDDLSQQRAWRRLKVDQAEQVIETKSVEAPQ